MLIQRLFLVTLALPLVSCNALQRDMVEVVNRSSRSLSELRLAYADETFERASLAPGKTFVVSPSPSRDGGILLSYKFNGQTVNHELGYTAPPISMTCKFAVAGRHISGGCHQN